MNRVVLPVLLWLLATTAAVALAWAGVRVVADRVAAPTGGPAGAARLAGHVAGASPGPHPTLTEDQPPVRSRWRGSTSAATVIAG